MGLFPWSYLLITTTKKRLICNSRFLAHTDPLLKKIGILKLHDIFKLKALKFYYRYIKNEVPNYFQNMFQVSPVIHAYNTRQRGSATLPIPTKSRNKNCIRYYIPNLITNIPPCIKDKLLTHSFHGFSTYAKSFFVNMYQEHCTIQNCYICNN